VVDLARDSVRQIKFWNTAVDYIASGGSLAPAQGKHKSSRLSHVRVGAGIQDGANFFKIWYVKKVQLIFLVSPVKKLRAIIQTQIVNITLGLS